MHANDKTTIASAWFLFECTVESLSFVCILAFCGVQFFTASGGATSIVPSRGAFENNASPPIPNFIIRE